MWWALMVIEHAPAMTPMHKSMPKKAESRRAQGSADFRDAIFKTRGSNDWTRQMEMSVLAVNRTHFRTHSFQFS